MTSTEQHFARLRQLLDQQRLVPALMFHGPELEELAGFLSQVAQVLFATDATPDQIPDLLWIKPEKSIKLEQVAEVQEHLELYSNSGRGRLAIIEQAELLSLPAANRLLKLLEELPERSFCFLSASRLRRVLPTIRSRCMPWRVTGLSPLPAVHPALSQALQEYSASRLFELAEELHKDKELSMAQLVRDAERVLNLEYRAKLAGGYAYDSALVAERRSILQQLKRYSHIALNKQLATESLGLFSVKGSIWKG